MMGNKTHPNTIPKTAIAADAIPSFWGFKFKIFGGIFMTSEPTTTPIVTECKANTKY